MLKGRTAAAPHRPGFPWIRSAHSSERPGGAVIALLLLSFVVDIFRDREAAKAETGAEAGPEPASAPMAGGFPVPPLPGQSLPPVPRRGTSQR